MGVEVAQFVELAFGQTAQHILQVGEGVDAVAATGLRQAVEHRGGAAAFAAAGEEPVLSTE